MRHTAFILLLWVLVLGCLDDTSADHEPLFAVPPVMDMASSTSGDLRIFENDLALDGSRLPSDTETGERVGDMAFATDQDTRDIGIIEDRDSGGRSEADVLPVLSFGTTVFAGTHNSYSGGDRGSIIEQLERGVRSLEFDFHDNDFGDYGDYRVGHHSPGGEVERGNGNPRSDLLTDWLMTVANWSRMHADHAPITLILDAKDNLRDNVSRIEGNLGNLNASLRSAFGDRIYTLPLSDPWPNWSELRGRIILVLSGDLTTRLAYLYDEGHTPALALSQSGRVVSMHSDGGERLWYWTGQRRGGSEIVWRHHGRYDTGQSPAVIFYDDRTVVEVHRSHTRARLFAAIGHWRDNGDIQWTQELELFDGERPTLRKVGDDIHLIYETDRFPSGRGLAIGRVTNSELVIGPPEETERSLGEFDRSRGFRAYSSDSLVSGKRVLMYSKVGTPEAFPICYEQLMFTEYQRGNSNFLRRNSRFAGFGSGRIDEVNNVMGTHVTRLWSFDQDDAARVYPNLAATDTPFERWFDRAMRDADAPDW